MSFSRKTCLAAAIGGCLAFTAQAAPPPDWAKLASDGALFLPGVSSARIVHFSADWAPVGQDVNSVTVQEGYPATVDGQTRFLGRMAVANGGLDLKVSLGGTASGGAAYQAWVRNATPVPTGDLSLTVELPADLYGGKALVLGDGDHVLPAQYAEATWQKHVDGGGGAVIPLADGRKLTIRGGSSLLVQDNRKFGSSTFSLRFRFTPAGGDLTEANVSLQITMQ